MKEKNPESIVLKEIEGKFALFEMLLDAILDLGWREKFTWKQAHTIGIRSSGMRRRKKSLRLSHL